MEGDMKDNGSHSSSPDNRRTFLPLEILNAIHRHLPNLESLCHVSSVNRRHRQLWSGNPHLKALILNVIPGATEVVRILLEWGKGGGLAEFLLLRVDRPTLMHSHLRRPQTNTDGVSSPTSSSFADELDFDDSFGTRTPRAVNHGIIVNTGASAFLPDSGTGTASNQAHTIDNGIASASASASESTSDFGHWNRKNKRENETLLEVAASEGALEVVELLLECIYGLRGGLKGNGHQQGQLKNSVLWRATKTDVGPNKKISRRSMQAGEEISRHLGRALLNSVKSGHELVVGTILIALIRVSIARMRMVIKSHGTSESSPDPNIGSPALDHTHESILSDVDLIDKELWGFVKAGTRSAVELRWIKCLYTFISAMSSYRKYIPCERNIPWIERWNDESITKDHLIEVDAESLVKDGEILSELGDRMNEMMLFDTALGSRQYSIEVLKSSMNQLSKLEKRGLTQIHSKAVLSVFHKRFGLRKLIPRRLREAHPRFGNRVPTMKLPAVNDGSGRYDLLFAEQDDVGMFKPSADASADAKLETAFITRTDIQRAVERCTAIDIERVILSMAIARVTQHTEQSTAHIEKLDFTGYFESLELLDQTYLHDMFRLFCESGDLPAVKLFLQLFPPEVVISSPQTLSETDLRNGYVRRKQESAFRAACKMGHVEIVRLLLGLPSLDKKNGDNDNVQYISWNVDASVRCGSSGRLAASMGHIEVLRALLQARGKKARCQHHDNVKPKQQDQSCFYFGEIK
ncbi:hypothetical protein HDU76_005863 [Blyttiomyces sp. JEL0837]|nr:hypothetical protein HDU76_005863 [Blyttiomyces sp. JEL0837]